MNWTGQWTVTGVPNWCSTAHRSDFQPSKKEYSNPEESDGHDTLFAPPILNTTYYDYRGSRRRGFMKSNGGAGVYPERSNRTVCC